MSNETIPEGQFVKYEHEDTPLAEVGVGFRQLVPEKSTETLNTILTEGVSGNCVYHVIQMQFPPPISLYCFSSQVFILGFSCSLTLLCIKTHLVKATTLLRNQSHPWLLKMFSGLMSKSIHMLMRNFCFKILFKNVYEEELFTLIILRCKRSCFKKRKE